ncbi:hypothetical protein [Fodinicola feengrottensis]|nr:hypothetical protein [Fodinicola feengrottensis]
MVRSAGGQRADPGAYRGYAEKTTAASNQNSFLVAESPLVRTS